MHGHHHTESADYGMLHHDINSSIKKKKKNHHQALFKNVKQHESPIKSTSKCDMNAH